MGGGWEAGGGEGQKPMHKATVKAQIFRRPHKGYMLGVIKLKIGQTLTEF